MSDEPKIPDESTLCSRAKVEIAVYEKAMTVGVYVDGDLQTGEVRLRDLDTATKWSTALAEVMRASKGYEPWELIRAVDVLPQIMDAYRQFDAMEASREAETQTKH